MKQTIVSGTRNGSPILHPDSPGCGRKYIVHFYTKRKGRRKRRASSKRQIPKTKSSQQRRQTKVAYMARSSTTLKGSLLEKRVRGMEKNKIKENHPNSLPYSPEKRVAFRTQYSPCLFLSLTSLLVSQRLVTSTLSRPLHFGVLNNKAITPILRWPLDNKGPGVTWIQQN